MSFDCGNCSSPIENHHSSNLDGAEPIACIHLWKSYTTVDFCMDIGDKAMVDIHVGISSAELWLFHFTLHVHVFTSSCSFWPSERVWWVQFTTAHVASSTSVHTINMLNVPYTCTVCIPFSKDFSLAFSVLCDLHTHIPHTSVCTHIPSACTIEYITLGTVAAYPQPTPRKRNLPSSSSQGSTESDSESSISLAPGNQVVSQRQTSVRDSIAEEEDIYTDDNGVDTSAQVGWEVQAQRRELDLVMKQKDSLQVHH